MNDFCSKCKNRSVPQKIKKKFNEHFKPTFIECPTSDPNIAGCLIEINFNIDWNSFCTWLNDQKLLTIQEAIEMARIGLFKEQKGKTIKE